MKQEHSEQFDVVIIGGGAAGLMAAITAARNGAKVAILEHKEKTGKKILSTGNGKCNYTNEQQGVSFFRGEDPAFVVPVFNQFGFAESVAFFEEIGVTPKVKNGYYYPASEQASAVLEVLRLEANYLRVREVCECEIKEIKQAETGFLLHTTAGEFVCKSVIFATGLLAAPKSGSDGSAFQHIEKFGHHFIDVVPALVPLQGKQAFFRQLAGIRAEIQAILYVENEEIASECGELQLTDYGVSGIPIFQLSRYATKALKVGKKVHIMLDFLPNLSLEETVILFEKRFHKAEQKKTVCECFVGLFNKKLAEVLIKEAGISLGDSPKKVSLEQIEVLARLAKGLRVDVTGSKSFEQAQVCAGGVDTKEINAETMESKLVKGLYFAGELVDIDGMCGGYNLQWAWSSGYVAGLHAAKQSIDKE
ncbi:MAG: NAD(P)/FAD-dependent oxidoreductase [Roseburia sp.]|nr:NAD(P)/FAD-dependent oxidoreductase [Roseburia sp.]